VEYCFYTGYPIKASQFDASASGWFFVDKLLNIFCIFTSKGGISKFNVSSYSQASA
jgi:hypothetical protein